MKVTAISSRDNPLVQRLKKLTHTPGAYRRLEQLWLEGDHLCRAYLQRMGPQQVLDAVVSETAWARGEHAELLAALPRVAVLADALWAQLSALESAASVGLVVAAPTQAPIDAAAPTVVLDRVQDAGNVGSILRSASAFGFKQVLALQGTAALWSPKVVRAGMGAHFSLRLAEGLQADALAALSVPLLATSSHAAATLGSAALPWPCAWVLGHEGQGVAEPVMERCSQTLRIPQPGGEESLNVAAAAAVCLYESHRIAHVNLKEARL
jgi:RNA methyltransferase, TrmH family